MQQNIGMNIFILLKFHVELYQQSNWTQEIVSIDFQLIHHENYFKNIIYAFNFITVVYLKILSDKINSGG